MVLLGAFDPPTLAHIEIVRAASRAMSAPGAFCFTRVLLARTDDALLPTETRAMLLDAIAERCRLGLVFANRGTYLDVARALRATGAEPTFVIGSDKLAQLADPSFYEDGSGGVDATFSELGLLVVPREGAAIDRGDVQVLDVFDDPDITSISATEVRRRVRAGTSVSGLVPREVEVALEGYTADR